ncbi:MAG: hypothetical protein ACYC4S_00590 [Rhodoferax sp.]
MQIKIDVNTKQVQDALTKAPGQINFALANAMNKTALQAKSELQTMMPRVFDRPTPWVINSLRVKFASKSNLVAEVAYKDKNSVESARSMIEPHVFGGKRHHKAFEARLNRIGLLPSGYSAVPGGAAKLDSYGNMSQGQISQLLNVLGAYTEAGFNKANINTVKRLAKGNVKKNTQGFVYWVNKVGSTRAKHLPPGVYQRVITAFGTSLKPVLIFVKQANYKTRFDFFGITQKVIDRDFSGNFSQAFDAAVKTGLLKSQGNLL